ncbi:MAG: hypothetical protein ACKO8Z_07410, partial [Prosthecobacter sp.]
MKHFITLLFIAEFLCCVEASAKQLWRGEFASADFGSFNPRGSEMIYFPAGIPFHRLKSLDENWPYKGKTNHAFPQDHGYHWRGYTLDAKRRPTFHYSYGEIVVADSFEDVRGENDKGWFKRTLQFEAGEAQQPFYFRPASGDSVSKVSEQSFKVGSLQLRITS